MSITYFCRCGERLRIPDEVAGKKVRCPKCAQVERAPQPAPLPEAIIVEAEAVEPERQFIATPPRVSTRPPPPLSDDSLNPAPDDVPSVEVVALIPAKSGAENERWCLELGDDEVRLMDDDGGVALKLNRDEANPRIQFPSFWLSVKNLQIMEGVTPKFQFQPDKKAMARIRAYLDRVLREDPHARRQYKQRGLAVILLGILGACVGGGVLAFLFATGFYQRQGYKGIGISIAGLVGGLVLMSVGFGMYRQAVRMGRTE